MSPHFLIRVSVSFLDMGLHSIAVVGIVLYCVHIGSLLYDMKDMVRVRGREERNGWLRASRHGI